MKIILFLQLKPYRPTPLYIVPDHHRGLALCAPATWIMFPGTEDATVIKAQLSSEPFPGALAARISPSPYGIYVGGNYAYLREPVYSFLNRHFQRELFYVSITPVS